MHNEFGKEEKYKLYRKVSELLHPTISKKNISDYKIIINDDLLPVRVSYPKKVSNIKSVFLFVHGDSNVTNCFEKYSDISSELALEFDKLVISIEYDEEGNIVDMYKKVFDTFKYIYDNLLESKVSKENITVMGDSTGGAIILDIIKKMEVPKVVLFYPVLSGEYFGKTKYNSIIENNKIDHDLVYKLKEYYEGYEDNKELFYLQNKDLKKYPNILLLIGNVDPLIDEAKEFESLDDNIVLKIVGFANHGFLGTNDSEMKKETFLYMHDFIEGDLSGKKTN